LTKEQKKAMAKDDIDLIDTSELENYTTHKNCSEIIVEHKINLAKAFLGKDGGYSLRRLKTMFKIERDK
jgi:hypothetical protein